MINGLLKKINNKSAAIGIIGLGYVGLPLVIRFMEEKFKVIGFDIDDEKCRKLNLGESYIRHIKEKSIQLALKNGFTATSNSNRITDVDFLSIQPGDVIESFADIDKSIDKLDYNPKIDIENGIPLFIDWYKFIPPFSRK